MNATPADFHFSPIATVHSPYREKFGIPRQPGLAAVDAVVELLPTFASADAVSGLDQFSHIWISFVFHAVSAREWKPLVRPPRLGGNEKIGVFATRSTHRPNPLGLSVVELLRVEINEGVRLHIRGGDLLDGTPVLDIKPYIPYADCIADARAGYAQLAPIRLVVRWQLDADSAKIDTQTQQLIAEVLSLDPRPAYQEEPARVYGMHIASYNVRFRIDSDGVEIIRIESLQNSNKPSETRK